MILGKNDITIVFLPAIYIPILKCTGKDDLYGEDGCRIIGV